MAWITIYIKGRGDFQEAVITRLEKTWLQGSPEGKSDLIMFWLPDTVTLRSLKLTIGSRLIFKYRLHFITNLNNHLKIGKDKSGEFSVSENTMIKKMVQIENTQREKRKAILIKIKPNVSTACV